MLRKKKKCAARGCQKETYTKLCTTHEAKNKIKKAKKKKAQTTKKVQTVKYPRLTTLKKHAWDAMSIFVRLRDSDKEGMCKCITCDTSCYFIGDCLQGGHFRSRKHLATFLHEQNVHGQCAKCNGFGNGMNYEYGVALNKLYGEGTAEMLAELQNKNVSYKGDYYIERIIYFTQSSFNLLNLKNFDKDLKDKIKKKLEFYSRFADKYK